ncbi:hypothetical protein niasHT_036664 [Heterodera trifolii]|uniref:Solute carrier organic anion transporter family member n=1 Tax=Heterodera trifolii TaxID=157864 RepID=A0ABD2IG87_9BILA
MSNHSVHHFTNTTTAMYTQSQFSLDEPLISEILQRSDHLIRIIEDYIHEASANLAQQQKDNDKKLGGLLWHADRNAALERKALNEAVKRFQLGADGQNAKEALAESLRHFVQNRKQLPEADLNTMRRSAVAAFSFCNKLVNNFRALLQGAKCEREVSNVGPLLIIFIAMLILGLGRTMPWALGIPLIDDNVKRHKMPMYFATINFFKIMGPSCGFLIGAAVNKLYYTFPASAPRGLSPQDPTWIGAWWMGFLLIGLMMIVPSITLFFFPESSKKKTQQNKVHDTNGTTINGMPPPPPLLSVPDVKEKKKLALYDRHVKAEGTTDLGLLAFLRSYSAVLSSKVYVGASIARVLDVFAFKGYFVFLPKFLENHYGIPQYLVHLYIALFGVTGFALGTGSGGVIMRKLRLNGRKAAYYVLIASTINTALVMAKSMLGCHSVVNNIGRDGIATAFNFTRECNMACGCAPDTAKLYPVCDVQGNAFYSPCHAGCRHAEAPDDELHFSECECAAGAGEVSREFCQNECVPMRNAYFVLVFVGAFIGGTAVVPGLLLLLRSVPPQSRSPALGLQGLLVSGIGTLPSPVIWGWLVDSACLVWNNECELGSCQFYDPRLLRLYMHWFYVVIRVLSLFADIYVCIHAKGLNLQEDDQHQDSASNSNNSASNSNTATKTSKVDSISLENIQQKELDKQI